jgi:hypothetical protein
MSKSSDSEMVIRLTGPRFAGGIGAVRERCNCSGCFERVVLTTIADFLPIGTVHALSTV